MKLTVKIVYEIEVNLKVYQGDPIEEARERARDRVSDEPDKWTEMRVFDARGKEVG